MNTTLKPPKISSPMTILWCGALVMTLSLGIRHAFGLFLQPMSLDNHWGREVFALAIALQNLIWGLSQPFIGRLADKLGSGPVILVGGLLYALGLALMSTAHSQGILIASAGVLIGLGLSCTTYPVVFGAISRVMPAQRQSMAMGICMALGSMGQFTFLPTGLFMINHTGWSSALLILATFAVVMIPLSRPLFIKRNNAAAIHPVKELVNTERNMMQTLKAALKHKEFGLLALGYFVCGFQVVFISTHLPSYLQDKGVSANAGSTALALIGLFNIFGSYTAGWLGGKLRKPMLLTVIYSLRALAILVFISVPPSATAVYVFGAVMGFIWLSTVSLTTGTVASMFGVKDLAMLGGLVFTFHQIGAFLGGWLGGLLFDLTGSYTVVWWICIGLSIVAASVSWPVQEKPAYPELAGAKA